MAIRLFVFLLRHHPRHDVSQDTMTRHKPVMTGFVTRPMTPMTRHRTPMTRHRTPL